MSMHTQQMEIETIGKREIALNLSVVDCKRIYDLTGDAGLTVSELPENFIGNLVRHELKWLMRHTAKER